MRMFWQNFRIYERKLAEGSAFLVYNGICNGQYLQKPKIFSFDAKTCLYELICHSHIEEDQTKLVYFMKKKKTVWSRKIGLIGDLRFLPLQWSSIVMAKIINFKLIQFFLIKLIFVIKQTGLFCPPLYVLVIWADINEFLCPKWRF